MAKLLNNLDSFLGIGSIEIDMPRRAAPGMDVAADYPGLAVEKYDWHWLEPPYNKPPKDTTEFYLYMLCMHNVLRCTYRMISESVARVRVYCLPADVGRSLIPRRDKTIKRYMRKVLDAVDVSKEGWNGYRVGGLERSPLIHSGLEEHQLSLFYLFNTLNSPRPDPGKLWTPEDRYLLQEILEADTIRGMKTKPFEYQKESIAMMLQRELAPTRTVDSRLKAMRTPTGEEYFLDQETCELFLEPSYYEDVRGGCLCEEMVRARINSAFTTYKC